MCQSHPVPSILFPSTVLRLTTGRDQRNLSTTIERIPYSEIFRIKIDTTKILEPFFFPIIYIEHIFFGPEQYLCLYPNKMKGALADLLVSVVKAPRLNSHNNNINTVHATQSQRSNDVDTNTTLLT